MFIDIKNDCVKYAKFLGDYQSIDIDTLANGYCESTDNGDETLRSAYLSALILRFWYTIDKMYKKGSGINLDREEYYTWLVEAIEYACKYRAWQDPEKKCNAQQAINKCIETIRLQHYYDFNLSIHRANYNNISLETPLSSDGSSESKTLADTLIASDIPEIEIDKQIHDTKVVIQDYINNKKIIEAIILDTIAFKDVEKHTKEVIKSIDENGKLCKQTIYHNEFWPYRLVQIVSKLPEDYDRYFSEKYSIPTAELSVALQAVRSADNQKLYRYLSKTLSAAKTNKRVLEMLG